jgi:hypothetical protein
MEFPLYIILIPYLIFILVWFIFSLVALYHMFKFGFKNITTYFTSFLYVLIATGMLAVSYIYLNELDWTVKISVLNNILNFDLPSYTPR